MITFQVMAFSQVSPHDDDAIGTFNQSIDYQVRVNHARAHYPDGTHVWRILHTGDTRQVSPGICAPVAEKSDDFGFKVFRHVLSPAFRVKTFI
jgi:hypothetical protein